MKLTITKRYTLNCKHMLVDINLTEAQNKALFGKCYTNFQHTHNYWLYITISGELEQGMIMNFVILDDIVTKNILNKFDHQYLNDLAEFKDKLTTVENMIQIFWDILYVVLKEKGAKLEQLRLHEEDYSFADLSQDKERCEKE